MRGDTGPGSDLPAPYRNPWRLLAADLRAVGASMVLKLRELWRLNGGGELGRPPFWPASLAALFWPSLLTLLVMGLFLFSRLPSRLSLPAARPPVPSAVVPQPEVSPRPDDPSLSPLSGAEPDPGRAPSPPEALEFPAAPPPPAAAASEPVPDPLLLKLGEGEIDPLVLSARVDPARSELQIELESAFAALSAAARQERAQRWWQRCQELGFEYLELRDGDGRLLGRTALVGSGMILLEPTPTA